jgi:MFS family permease
MVGLSGVFVALVAGVLGDRFGVKLVLGLAFTLSNLGAFVSPPLGNSLAGINSGLPLLFWASLSLAAVITLIFTKETRQKASPASYP